MIEKKDAQKLNRATPITVRASFTKDQDAIAAGFEAQKLKMTRSAAEGSFSPSGFTDVTNVPLLYVDPMFDPILLMFPKENIKELNRRLRHYYTYDPIIRSGIDLLSEFGLSDFELRCEDKDVEVFYNEIKERISLLPMMVNMNRDYWLLGNAIHYGNWDQTNSEWTSFNMYPPENVDIHKTYVGGGTVYFLKADDELKKILNSSKEVDRAISSLIPDEFKDSVRSGKPFQLANERVIYFARRPSGYSLYGESIVKSVLKDLLYQDKLRLLQLAFVDRQTSPIKLWKIGSAEKGWIPSKKHYREFQQQLIASSNNSDQNIITHPFVNLDMISPVGKTADIIREFEFVQKRILMGLFISEGMLRGEASPYASQAVSMKVVMHRFLTNRILMEKLIKEKVFLPMAIAHGFIKRTEAELAHKVHVKSNVNYYLPRFFYTQRLNLLNNSAEQDMLLRLRDKGEIPYEILADVFGFDSEAVRTAFKKEQSTELDPVWRDARKEIAKIPQVRNQILDGTKLEETTIPEVSPLDKGGRPVKPEGEKFAPIPAIIPPGPGEASPRTKQQEKGTIPAPMEPFKEVPPGGPVVPPEVKL